MTPMLPAALLAAIAAIAAWRQWRRGARAGDAPWRRFALVAGQAALAATLYFVLLPPARPGVATTLVVLAEGAPRSVPVRDGERVVALPGADADADAGIERVPDLGTALRRHPGAGIIRVHGDGLPARDRDAARGRAIDYVPSPAPAGLAELQLPAPAVRGHRLRVRARFEATDGGRVDLLDPSGARVDRQPLGDDGRVALAAVAGPVGRVVYRLQRRNAADAVVEDIALPVQVVDGAPLRLLVLAGGVNPESKYLRRWATDAGLALQSQAAVGGGVDVGTPAQALTAARLADLDLVVLDDRAWRGLGEGGRATLREAVRGGLGVLLRLTADPGAGDRALLKAWGFEAATADVARSVRLPGTELADPADPAAVSTEPDAAPPENGADRADDPAPLLTRRALRLGAADGVPLLRDVAGETLALWRAEGRGRIAVWNLADSFRLQLSGRRAAYGSLWADAAATLARGRDTSARRADDDRRVGERSVFCAVGDSASIVAADGTSVALRRDPAAGGCAAWWPAAPGWHRLDDGDATTALLVRAGDDAPGLARAARRDATRVLAAQPVDARVVAAAAPVRGSRWPWAAAWLLVAAAMWWLERTRRGRGRAVAAPVPPV